MAYDGHNLPAYNFFATIEEGLPDFEQCPECGMWFAQMEERADMEAHINRCVERAAAEERDRIRLGYKKTSLGWFKEGNGGLVLP
jgi:hypothetical protein